MFNKMLFRRPENVLEGSGKIFKQTIANIPEEMCSTCPSCKKALFTGDLPDLSHVCPHCSHHFRIRARQRLCLIADEESFTEHDAELISPDMLGFPGYSVKLKNARAESGENEAVVCGICRINGRDAAIFVMDPFFMMGSMGTAVGEKITRLFEYAALHSLPVVGFTVSGGARMQEGILSLMQMAKVSGAVRLHSEKGNLYIAVLTDPTTGGVTASFAMEGDIIIAEPQALIGFAGARVIEQTIKQKLPQGFQRAEFLLEKGFVDDIVDRRRQKDYIAALIGLHTREVNHDGV